MYRFLASKRWIVRTIAGILLVLACVRLGLWQLDRNDERAERNDRIETGISADPAPIENLAEPGRSFDDENEWRSVQTTGRYDIEHQLVLELRPVDGEQGVHVLTPLVTADGSAVLVDRGFVPTDGPATEIPDLPEPPSGTVAVDGRLRQSEDERGAGNGLDEGKIRYVNIDDIAEALPYDLYPAWVERTSEDPAPAGELTAIPAPEMDAGPHLSYAVQWFVFACIGVGGFILLIRAEARGRRQLESAEDEPLNIAAGPTH